MATHNKWKLNSQLESRVILVDIMKNKDKGVFDQYKREDDIEVTDGIVFNEEIKEEVECVDLDQLRDNLGVEYDGSKEERKDVVECKTESEFLYNEEEQRVVSDSSDDISVETRCEDNQPRRKRLKHQHNNSTTTNKSGEVGDGRRKRGGKGDRGKKTPMRLTPSHTMPTTPAKHHTMPTTPAKHHTMPTTPAKHHAMPTTPAKHHTPRQPHAGPSNKMTTLTPPKLVPLISHSDEEHFSSLSGGSDWDVESAGEERGAESDDSFVAGPDSEKEVEEGDESEEEEEEEGDESEEEGEAPWAATLPSFVWNESDGSDFNPNIHDFDHRKSGVTNEWPCDENASEIDYFTAFFDDTIMDLLASETNRYSTYVMENSVFSPRSSCHRWVDTTVNELYVFFALLMLMPLIKKHALVDYWKNDPLLQTPVFAKFMTRDRMLLLLRFLHFADNNDSNQHDCLWKVRDVFTMILNRFKNYFYPFRKLVIDESLVLFKGRLKFKQYLPSKRHRCGMKLYVLCDCETGIVLDMIMYTGTEVDIEKPDKNDPLGTSGAIVKKLMSPYMDKGHVLYTNNWYTSPSLSQYLHDHSTGSCGTVRTNRKFMTQFEGPKTVLPNPSESSSDDQAPQTSAKKKKKKNMKKLKFIKREMSGNILAIQWRDERDMVMLTTLHQGQMTDSGKRHRKTKKIIMKPDAVLDYNKNMRLIDNNDYQLSGVECIRRTVKWYQKFFLHLVDVTVLNAYNIYLIRTGNAKKLKLREFIYNICYQLLDKYGILTSSDHGRRVTHVPDRLQSATWVMRHYLISTRVLKTGKKKQQLCTVCKKTVRRPQKRTKVTTMCAECAEPLCPSECFRDFHALLKY